MRYLGHSPWGVLGPPVALGPCWGVPRDCLPGPQPPACFVRGAGPLAASELLPKPPSAEPPRAAVGLP